MKHKHFNHFMQIAETVGMMSYATRRKVGAICVTPKDTILYSYNGTAPGDDNACEDGDGVTLDEVIHAEANIITKVAKSGLSLEGSTMFVTLAPCLNCAKMIFSAGIERVVFKERYKDMRGVAYLKSHGVHVEEWNEE